MYLKHVQIFVPKITILPDLSKSFEYNYLYYDKSKMYNTNYEKKNINV